MKKEFEHKIGIIICWFGKWPWYFKYFLHSVKFNPTIDFIIITDEPINEELPKNVKLIFQSLDHIRLRANEKMNIDVSLSSAYKLCDFKPAYGEIFEEYLEGYDFWGHGDIDIIFGNIRNFIEDEILNTYDVISVHNDYIHGCFALFRNTQKINALYKCSKDFEKVFTTKDSYAFDECNGLNYYLTKEKKQLEEIPYEIESMTHIVKKKEAAKEIKPYFNLCLLEHLIGKIRWDKGTLTYNNKIETIAYHLYHFKKEPYLTIPPKSEVIGDYFYIGKSGIYNYSKKSFFTAFLKKTKGYFKKCNYLIRLHSSWNRRCRKASLLLQGAKPEYLNIITGHYKNFNTNIIIFERNNSIYVKTDDGTESVMYHEDNFTFLIKEQYLAVEFNKVVNDRPCFITTDGKKINHTYYKQDI